MHARHARQNQATGVALKTGLPLGLFHAVTHVIDVNYFSPANLIVVDHPCSRSECYLSTRLFKSGLVQAARQRRPTLSPQHGFVTELDLTALFRDDAPVAS